MVDGERHKDGPAARWRWSGPDLSPELGYQELGRLPWLAAFLRRAFFLRDFFAISASGLWVVATVDRSWPLPGHTGRPVGPHERQND
jgi:hypothetical protein